MKTNTKVHHRKLHDKTRILFVALLTVLAIIALAGCGNHAGPDTTTTAVTTSECSTDVQDDAQVDFRMCVITMPDTRRVTCIARTPRGGLSCDWIHADGSDRMGEAE